jgi:transposase
MPPRSGGSLNSHKVTIHVAVITGLGQPVADAEFPTTSAGSRRAVAWLMEQGLLRSVGVEGTSSYGVGSTAAVTTAGIGVVEVNRTRPAERRKQGKADRLDAHRAARSVLFGQPLPTPRPRASNPCGR